MSNFVTFFGISILTVDELLHTHTGELFADGDDIWGSHLNLWAALSSATHLMPLPS